VAELAHLARRFVESLWPAPPTAADDAWALQHLNEGEAALWRSMQGFDRRHAVGVARRVLSTMPDAPRPVIAAALLHDVGKVDARLGVFARVAATLWRGLRGAERVASGDGRVARYVKHPDIGRRQLTEAGADPFTAAWAAEHHLTEAHWSVPVEIGRVLKHADDD
jgi:hypothetical protein